MATDSEIKNKIVDIFFEETLKETPIDPNNHLNPPEMQMRKIKLEVAASVDKWITRLLKGYDLLLSQLRDLNQRDPETITPEIIEEFENIGHRAENHEEIKSLKELFHLSESALKAGYLAGLEYYNIQDFKNASDLFFLLTVLDPTQYSVWLGLGNSEFYCQQYDEALIAFSMCTLSNPDDPISLFYGAQCYEKLNQIDNAVNSLEIALYVISNNSDLKEWQEKINNYMQSLLAKK